MAPSDSRCAAARFRHGLIRAALPRPRAAQTGLSCSVHLRARVLRPLPRRDPPHLHHRTGARSAWPSPCDQRLGSRIVNMSRLQASRHVAARVLAPSSEAFDTPLGPPRSLAVPGVCYSALRRLPRRDLHPLETNSVKQSLTHPLRHDARTDHSTSKRSTDPCSSLPLAAPRRRARRRTRAREEI